MKYFLLVLCFFSLFALPANAQTLHKEYGFTEAIANRSPMYELWDGGIYTFSPLYSNATFKDYDSNSVDKCLYPIWRTDSYSYDYGEGEVTTFAEAQTDGAFRSGVLAFFVEDKSKLPAGYYVHSSCFDLPTFQVEDGNSDNAICKIPSSSDIEKYGVSDSLANKILQILPSSPESMRLPTIISNLGGEGSLAGNLAVELYSAIWQYLAIIVFVKFYKLIPGKMT